MLIMPIASGTYPHSVGGGEHVLLDQPGRDVVGHHLRVVQVDVRRVVGPVTVQIQHPTPASPSDSGTDTMP